MRKQFDLPERVLLHDATLRDGEQTPGVVFTKNEKVEMAKLLDRLGVDRIEAGMPAVSPDDAAAVKEIASAGLRAKVMAFCRAVRSDIEIAIECGVWGTVIEVASGEERLKRQFASWTPDDVFRKATDSIKCAKDCGMYVTFFPYDTTRANLGFLAELCGKAREAGADSIAVVDTTGTATPAAMRELVRLVRGFAGGLTVEVHTHNDLGMGVANALAGVEAGACVVHGCINGLGERCGNAALEEIAVALKACYGLQLGVDFARIVDTCRAFERFSGVRLPINKPIAGYVAFAKESGIGIEMVKLAPTITFPIKPEFVGASPRIVLGKKSGKGSVRMKLEELGVSVPEDRIDAILEEVKLRSIQKKASISDEEFLELVEKHR
ncbi:MAG: LeuA family protein [Bacillota bacterium]